MSIWCFKRPHLAVLVLLFTALTLPVAVAAPFRGGPLLAPAAGVGLAAPSPIDPIGLVKDINPGTLPSSPSDLVVVGHALYFTADDDRLLRTLWRADGADLTLISDSRFKNPANLAELGGLLYFAAATGANLASLWRSDGTYAGTNLLGTFPALPTSLTPAAGRLFFLVGYGLWETDGTPPGTHLVRSFASTGPNPSATPSNLTAAGARLFFSADDGSSGAELWASDGTLAGTYRVKDIYPGETCSQTDHGPECAPASSAPAELQLFKGALLFAASTAQGRTLWRSDGTAAATLPLSQPSTGPSDPAELTVVSDALLFAATDDAHGYHELWKSDGTVAGTSLLKDIVPGASGSDLEFLATIGSTLFFRAQEQLWKSDGTPAGTVLVKAILPSDPMALNGTLFFAGYDTTHGFELWKSDGTPVGTTMVKDLVPGPISSFPWQLTVRNDRLDFITAADSRNVALWQSDGTAAGTTLVKDFSGKDVRGLTNIGGTLLFYTINPAQIWKSDGSAAGTVPIKNLDMSLDFPGPVFTLAGNHVFFGANDGIYGNELWAAEASDGVDAYLAAPALVGAPPAGAVAIPIAYNNKGTSAAASTVLTATLAPGLTYLGDTSGVNPTLSGNSASWRLPEIAFLSGRQFTLRLGVPAASFGARYAVGLQLATAGADVRPADNIAQLDVLIAHQRYLPVVGR
jgi:ELWxxDGT repeat protein